MDVSNALYCTVLYCTALYCTVLYSKETKEVIKLRYIALDKIKQTNNNMDEIRNYKTLRNRTHKLI